MPFPALTTQNNNWNPEAIYGIVFGIAAVVLGVPGTVAAWCVLRPRKILMIDSGTVDSTSHNKEN